MGGNEGCTRSLKAATVSDISYLFGRGNFILIRERSGNSQEIVREF